MFIHLFTEVDPNPAVNAVVSVANGMLALHYKCVKCNKREVTPGALINPEKQVWFMKDTVDPYHYVCPKCKKN
jgi:DNA-directed RNA polymerase subunit RPC12/RpoP